MGDLVQVYDVMMGNTTEGDLDEELFVQQVESMVGENEVLTKEQTDFLVMCKAVANSTSSPPSELSLLVEIQQFLHKRIEIYKDKTIYYLMDVFMRGTNCTHSTRSGMAQVTCKLTNQKMNQTECVYFTVEVLEMGQKNLCVGKQFVPLSYALFFVIRFQECLVRKIKMDPGADDSEYSIYFSKLEESMNYIAYHLPV